jgi:hypothetical protein
MLLHHTILRCNKIMFPHLFFESTGFKTDHNAYLLTWLVEMEANIRLFVHRRAVMELGYKNVTIKKLSRSILLTKNCTYKLSHVDYFFSMQSFTKTIFPRDFKKKLMDQKNIFTVAMLGSEQIMDSIVVKETDEKRQKRLEGWNI